MTTRKRQNDEDEIIPDSQKIGESNVEDSSDFDDYFTHYGKHPDSQHPMSLDPKEPLDISYLRKYEIPGELIVNTYGLNYQIKLNVSDGTSYELGKHLGTGTFGAAFMAMHRDGPVVIKIMKTEHLQVVATEVASLVELTKLAYSDEGSERDMGIKLEYPILLQSSTLREMRAQVRSPEFKPAIKIPYNPKNEQFYIASGLAGDKWRGNICYAVVITYIKGMSLSKLYSTKSLTPDDAVTVSYELAKKLSILHNNFMVHRDLSPNNILISRAPDNELDAYIIDYGSLCSPRIIEKLKDKSRCSQVGVGTVTNLAPELSNYRERKHGNYVLTRDEESFLESLKDPDTSINFFMKADIWAIGIDMLLMTLPVHVHQLQKDVNGVQISKYGVGTRDTKNINKNQGIYSDTFTAIIRWCLQYDPVLRPTATELMKALYDVKTNSCILKGAYISNANLLNALYTALGVEYTHDILESGVSLCQAVKILIGSDMATNSLINTINYLKGIQNTNVSNEINKSLDSIYKLYESNIFFTQILN